MTREPTPEDQMPEFSRYISGEMSEAEYADNLAARVDAATRREPTPGGVPVYYIGYGQFATLRGNYERCEPGVWRPQDRDAAREAVVAAAFDLADKDCDCALCLAVAALDALRPTTNNPEAS